jgi:hypothetical protein
MTPEVQPPEKAVSGAVSSNAGKCSHPTQNENRSDIRQDLFSHKEPVKKAQVKYA